MEYYLLIIRMVNFEKIDERSSTRISCTQPFETPYNCAWNIAARAWGGGGGEREGSPRRDHLWFGRWDSGNSTHSRTEEDRWKLAWLGRTDGRTSERTERRTLKREKTTSECDRDMAGAEEWGGRETRSEREREREKVRQTETEEWVG